MKWMLRMYPRAWRRRYGEEFLELVAEQPWSVALVVDVAAGAIDAWLSPQVSLGTQPAAAGEEIKRMFVKTLNLHCAGRAPGVTRSDALKSGVVMITATLVLTALWLWTFWSTRENRYVDTMALLPLTYFAPYFYTLRYTYLKARPPATQALFIGGAIALFTVFFLAIGWLSARI